MICSFNESDPGCSCGPDDRNPSDSKIVTLSSCSRDLSSHLLSLGLVAKRSKKEQTLVSEVDLILNRAGMFDTTPATIADLTICPRHRYHLTLNWPGSKNERCAYPTQKSSGKKKKGKAVTRRANKTFSEEINRIHSATVPIGSCEYSLIYFCVCLIFNYNFFCLMRSTNNCTLRHLHVCGIQMLLP